MMSAEGAAAGASTDVVDGVMMKAGEVVYKGKDHELTVLDKGLRLVGFSATQPGTRETVLDLCWRDVVCACAATPKKSKSAAKVPASSPVSNSFIIHYIAKNPKTKKRTCKNVQLDTKDGDAENWIVQIEKMRKEDKPQKLLVIINPIGGKGTARKDFERISRPLFDLAGIELVVKVTERSQHAREIAENFDTSTVDGVIIVGGDGLYMEVLHTLILKHQQEAGIDVNDPEAKLVSPSFNFGIIPGGTGNGTSAWLNEGLKDFQTATLNIIRGETNATGIFSVHEPGKLIHYGGILVGYGLYTEMMDVIDDMRWMKTARLAYVSLTKLFGKKKIYNLDVEVLKALQQEKDIEDADSKGATSAESWTKIEVKPITAVLALLAHVDMETEGDKFHLDPFTDVFHINFMSAKGGFEYGKMLHEYTQMKKATYQHDFTHMVNHIKAVRFKLKEGETKDETGTSAGAGQKDYSRMVDIDGEVLPCTVPNIEIRLRPYLIKAYSVKEQV